MSDVATCFKCGKQPHELQEYIDGAAQMDTCAPEDAPHAPLDYMLLEEGTYNRKTKHFACTPCYIKIGMPSMDRCQGWMAP